MDSAELQIAGEKVSVATVTQRPMSNQFAKNVNIIRELAIADFRLKYHDSALGYIWSMLNPLLMFAIYYFVFTYIFHSTIQYYPIFLLIGILNYAFFQDCTFSAMASLGAKSGLMKKIYFPKSLIVLAAASTAIISYFINTIVMIILVLVFKGFTPLMLLLPVPIMCLIAFTAGISFLLATLYSYFRDMSQIWGVLVLVLFWVSPIVFDVDALPPTISNLVYFNPLTRIFGLLRHYLIYDYFDLRFLIMTALYSSIVFVTGYMVFKRHEEKFPELF